MAFRLRPMLLAAIAIALLWAATPQLAKDKTQPAGCASCELDTSYSLLIGQRGFYQLADEEGGVSFNQFGQLEPGGRKVPAFIAAVEFVRNKDGSLVFNERGGLSPLRDASGTIVVCVHVLRPANKGGSFDRCDAAYGSREAGGFDIVQPADLTGF